MKTILSGSLAYDRIMEFSESFSDYLLADKLGEINVCFMVNGMKENFGGTAGNIGYALKLMGGLPEISATIGRDAQRYLDWFAQNGISKERITVIEEEWTAGAYITTDKNDNQLTSFNPGAMNHSSKLDFSKLDSNDLVIISPGNLDDMNDYPRLCRENNIPYIFDPGQALPVLQGPDLLNNIDGCMLLMVNEYEMNLIQTKTEKSREEIIQRAGSAVITKGESGSVLYTDDTETIIPVTPAKVVSDPTGAGDAYRGGLLYGLLQKKTLEECCKLGSVCSSFAVECYGTQEYTFTREQFESRYQHIR